MALRILLAATLALVLGACGAAGRSSPASAPQAASTSAAEDPGAHAEIARLWDEIDGWRGQSGAAGMGAREAASESLSEAASADGAEPAASGVDPAQAAATIAPPDAACPAAVSEPAQCRDSCTLATSICSNAGRICRLAEQLAGDDWAAGKCADAAAVCRQATSDCCGCRAGS